MVAMQKSLRPFYLQWSDINQMCRTLSFHGFIELAPGGIAKLGRDLVESTGAAIIRHSNGQGLPTGRGSQLNSKPWIPSSITNCFGNKKMPSLPQHIGGHVFRKSGES